VKVGLDVHDGVLVVNFLLVGGVPSFGLGFGNWLFFFFFFFFDTLTCVVQYVMY
jgi:hypothetical protein